MPRSALMGAAFLVGIGLATAQVAPGPPQPLQQPGTPQQPVGDPTAPNVVPGAPPAFVPGAGSGNDALATAPRVVRISGGVISKSLISKVDPVYPPEARAAHVSGSVVMEAHIGKNGHVESLGVLSGPQPLQAAAVDAVKQWVYRPYSLNGQPVPVVTTITINFNR